MIVIGIVDKIALIEDGTIVRVNACSKDSYRGREIYFTYLLFDRLKFKKKSAFINETQILAYSYSKKELKKFWRRQNV